MFTLSKGAGQVIANDAVLYYTENYTLNFYDLNSAMQTPLCNRIVCLHNDDSCTAVIPDSLCAIFLSKNIATLFITYLDAGRNTQVTTKMDLDGAIKVPLTNE